MTAVISRRLAAAAAGLVLSCAAVAQTAAPGAAPLSPMQPMQSIPPHGPGMMGRGPGPAFGPGGPHGMGPHHGGAPFLRGLALSEEQRDKIFAIEYAQMPEAREQRKAIEHARRDLHQMVTSGQYDEARARSLTESLGRAVAREAQLRAQAGAKVMQVLTPEQRKQIADREAQRVAELAPERDEGAPMPELVAM
ncbi:Spy/CpxP family protein refolding chaperone [Ralstonia pickettii]|uniref:Spy/CpxP family protein refolding chaperone n=1 Tax=Ralstonia pickettii TaxID=329 RepID=UPI0015BD3B23|nr:Spy/CpxP family protein refolding chaperone [Ralstonia pickettii]NWK47429.1 Spy/CpxP family protein refolding chaperone [Ralstonia pickettii]